MKTCDLSKIRTRADCYRALGMEPPQERVSKRRPPKAPPLPPSGRYHTVEEVAATHGLSMYSAASHVGTAAIRWDRAEGGVRHVSAEGWAKYVARFKRPLPEVLPEPEWDDRPVPRGSYVYFLRAGREGLVKIGMSSRPARRIGSFRLYHPDPPEVLAVVRGDRRLEKALHIRFAKHRRTHEWFEPAAELMALIASLPRLVLVDTLNKLGGRHG